MAQGPHKHWASSLANQITRIRIRIPHGDPDHYDATYISFGVMGRQWVRASHRHVAGVIETRCRRYSGPPTVPLVLYLSFLLACEYYRILSIISVCFLARSEYNRQIVEWMQVTLDKFLSVSIDVSTRKIWMFCQRQLTHRTSSNILQAMRQKLLIHM